MTRNFGWTKNVLIHQIENQTYEKTLLSKTSFEQTLPDTIRKQAKLAVRDEYIFDFLEMGEEHDERRQPQIAGAKRMTARCENLTSRHEITNQLVLEISKFRPVIVGRHLVRLGVRVIGDKIVIDEFHRIGRQAEQGLIGPEGLPSHALPQLPEGRRGVILEADSRIRGPYPGGQRRTDIGR